MSEHIIDVSKATTGYQTVGNRSWLMGAPIKERIIRCKDCKFYNETHHKCHRAAIIIDVNGNVYLTDEENGYLSMTDANPDGFCAWSERSDAE